MAQTPQQRRANAQFAREQERKMGRPTSSTVKKEKPQKAPVNKWWLYMLLFVVCGGLIFELVRLMFTGATSGF